MAKDSESGGYGSIPQSEDAPPAEVEQSLMSEMVGEFFGTTTLVQIGTGANCVAVFTGTASGMWQIAVIWVLAATLGIYSTASISGGHINPAVSFAMALVRPGDFPMKKLIPFWCAQVLGGMAGCFLNLMIFGHAVANLEDGLNVTRGDSDSLVSAGAFSDYWNEEHVSGCIHATFLEAFGTGVLVFMVCMATNPKSKIPASAVPPLVGITIGSMIHLIGPLTNAGINPARDLGPRIVLMFAGWGATSFHGWLAYLIGPLVGGPIGAFLADRVLMA